eukprot:5033955-Prymnesium_polylepis.1
MNFRNDLHSDPLCFGLPETGTALDFPLDFPLEMNRRPEYWPNCLNWLSLAQIARGDRKNPQ